MIQLLRMRSPREWGLMLIGKFLELYRVSVWLTRRVDLTVNLRRNLPKVFKASVLCVCWCLESPTKSPAVDTDFVECALSRSEGRK